MRYAWAGIIWLCLSGACDGKRAEVPASEKAKSAQEQTTKRADPTAPDAALARLEESAQPHVGLVARRNVARKPRACVAVAEGSVRAGAARGFLSRRGTYFDLLVVSDSEPRLELWRGAKQGFRQAASLALESPAKQAAFAYAGERAFAAWIDERARVMLVPIEGGKFGRPRSLAEGVDRRMPPALAHLNSELLLAFTRSVGESMHVHVARVENERSTVEDLTPQGHGAGAPTFIAGAYPPVLVAVDARAGVSPLLEIAFNDQGRAQPAVVRTPVSQPYAPPALAAAQLAPSQVVVAYTAIGRAAATAIGLVPLRTSEAATALVPSNGYGELSLRTAQQAGLAVFAMEAFKESGKDSPRKVLVGLVEASGVGELLELGAEASQASAPSVYPGEGNGEFSVAYTAPDGVRVAELLCTW